MARVRDSETFSNEEIFKLLKKHPLPPRARARLLDIRARASAYDAAADAFWNQHQKILEGLRGLKSRRDRAESPEEREYFDEQIADVDKQLADLKKTRNAAGAITIDFSDEITRAAVKLARSDSPLRDYEPDLPIDSANDAALLEASRAKIVSLQKQERSLDRAASDPKEIMARIDREIASLASAGAPDLHEVMAEERRADGSYTQLGSVRWPRALVGDNFAPNGLTLLLWVFKDEVRKRIEKEVTAKSKGLNVIPLAERGPMLKKIANSLLLESRTECALVWRLHEAGRSDIHFRSDVDARAFLGIRVGRVGR